MKVLSLNNKTTAEEMQEMSKFVETIINDERNFF
jgi:hypothetical protein